jgi:hypothetical protein
MKMAYPMDIWSNPHLPTRNMDRWIGAMRDIYAFIRKGADSSMAFDQITSTWDEMEKLQFKNWMRYYQSDNQEKYVTAQYHLQSQLPQPQRQVEPTLPIINNVVKEQQLKDWKGALLSRLYAAEKILGKNSDLQLELQQQGLDVRKLLGTLHWLTEEIQTAKLRRSSALLTTIVLKNASRLINDGFTLEARAIVRIAMTNDEQLDRQDLINSSKILQEGMWNAAEDMMIEAAFTDDSKLRESAEELFVLAQMVQNEMGVSSPTNPQGVAVMNPGDGIGAVQPVAPSGDATAPNFGKVEEAEGDDADANPAMKEFLKNISGDKDKASADDEDMKVDASSRYMIEVLAQAVPDTLPEGPTDDVTAPTAPADIEVNDAPEVQNVEPVNKVINIDDNFEAALHNVKVPDIIVRLEGVAKLFKNREISRQLSIIDLMMDSVGIAPFFPSMAETMQKSLEANQYCQTRVEDILAKLRGTVSTPTSRSLQDQVIEDPAESAVREKLQQQELAEQAKKERRRTEALAEEAATAATPPPAPAEQVEPIGQKAQQELAGPAALPNPQPQAVRPQ